MPIYAYRCAACGFSRDVLQKLSDAPLTVCPACGAEAFSKQVTAAGFQLKGSGWYVTDFRDNGKGGKGGGSGKSDPDGATPGTSAPAPSAAPAAGTPGGSASGSPPASPAPSSSSSPGSGGGNGGSPPASS